MTEIYKNAFTKSIYIDLEKENFKIEIETERLLIRNYKQEDFTNCLSLYGNEAITKYFDQGKPRTESEIKTLIKEKCDRYFFEKKPFGLFSIFEKSGMTFIGQIDFIPLENQDTIEIGFILHQEHQKKGFCTEAAKAIIFDYTHEINKRKATYGESPITKIIATAHPENQSSIKVLKKIGLIFDKAEERFGQPRSWYSLQIPLTNTKGFIMDNTPSKHLWQAEDYHHHSTIQYKAAMELLQHLSLKGDENILDVGCGDGKITATVAKKVCAGHVTGIDISPEMIKFAAQSFSQNDYPNLKFEIQGAQDFNYHKQLDIIFSSFALQWLPEPDLFFKCARNSLKESGYIAATIPLDISLELQKSIDAIISLPQWSSYFEAFSPNWHFVSPNKYEKLLIDHQFTIQKFNIHLQTMIFPSREDFENYVIQWFSYLNALPEKLKTIFFKEVIDKYLAIKPSAKTGEIEFSFSRVDFIAKIS